MTTIVVWHSVMGRRPAVDRFAESLRTDDRDVVVPDIFEGRTFDTYDPAIAERDRIGFTSLLARAEAAMLPLPDDLVHIGFSMGGAPAMLLAAGRPGCRGLVLVQAAMAPEAMGLERWPAGLSLQLHTSPGDPWQPDDEVAALVAAVPHELLEHHEYPGTGHLFADEDLPAHDASASQLLGERILDWLAVR